MRSATNTGRAAFLPPSTHAPQPRKPTPNSTLNEIKKFVEEKYVKKRYVRKDEQNPVAALKAEIASGSKP